MSREIKVVYAPIERSLSELRSSLRELETTFSKEINNDNKLEMFTIFNEVQQEYDAVFTQFESLFLNNIESANNAVFKIQETDRRVAGDIRLMK